MGYNIKDLNISSLDYTDIVQSLITFLEKQPTLKDIDFRNTSSAANMLINILATATAYNGVYSYFGFNESFKSSAQNLESFAALASNESILLPFTQSASTQAAISTTAVIPAYTGFSALGTDGSQCLFFNIAQIPIGSGNYTLYAGTQSVLFTTYDVDSQSLLLPITVDPRTITFKTIDVISGTETIYTRVDRGEEATSSGNYFTVINGPNGYLVTNNFVNSTSIDVNKKVEVAAVLSNGSSANNSTMYAVANSTIISQSTPSGGYNNLSVEQARSKILINGNGRKRWVTLNDLKYAIMSSGISGTDDENLITVANDSLPWTVKVYVTGLTASSQTDLTTYLQTIGPAGISINYSL